MSIACAHRVCSSSMLFSSHSTSHFIFPYIRASRRFPRGCAPRPPGTARAYSSHGPRNRYQKPKKHASTLLALQMVARFPQAVSWRQVPTRHFLILLLELLLLPVLLLPWNRQLSWMVLRPFCGWFYTR